jgi:hypothetical protein
MKKIGAILLLFILTNTVFGQDNFIKIETNKTLALLSFAEAASSQRGTSSSFHQYIIDSLGGDHQFVQFINDYAQLNIDYTNQRPEYPDTRHSNLNTKDLLWIAASNSKNLNDFSERIIGILPHATHNAFIRVLEQMAPYYDDLIWQKEQANILRMEQQLEPYKKQIEDVFLSVSTFYNSDWNTKISFKILLYPIPLNQGNTTAIPMGNALICGYLSHNAESYISLLGVIVHEMCHVLYGEQSPEMQHELEQWFLTSESAFKKLAYNYVDEGLATALGNGWAYEQMNGVLDTGDWYNDAYINGFAKTMYPLTKKYLNNARPINKEFVSKSIALFAKKFPKALRETKILMNEVQIFSNTEIESEIDVIVNALHNHFNVRSMWLSTPIADEQSVEKFGNSLTTKLFIVDSDNEKTLAFLDKAFPDKSIRTPINTMDVFQDEATQSTVIIINLSGVEKLNELTKLLSEIDYLDYGKNYALE